MNIENLIEKFEISILTKIEKENFKKIITFLIEEKVDYIYELIENYLDLFIIDYDEFKMRFNKLKEYYGDNLVELISENMNILEEF